MTPARLTILGGVTDAVRPGDGTDAAPAVPRPAPPPPAKTAQPPASTDDVESGGTRILVAEDEALIRLDLVEMLKESGYRVVGQASDGEQAVELCRRESPDLVVMDVKMPVMDGVAAAEIIGGEGLAPVVMLTAFSDKDLVERARDAGVMAYVVKPFTIDDLRPAIDIARSRWVELKALEREVADLGERLETRRVVDRAKGILMTTLEISEPEAFRWIQKTAMDRRLGMREVAVAVIRGLPGEAKGGGKESTGSPGGSGGGGAGSPGGPPGSSGGSSGAPGGSPDPGDSSGEAAEPNGSARGAATKPAGKPTSGRKDKPSS